MIDGYGRVIIGEILDGIGRVFRAIRFICKKQDFTEMVAGKGFKYFLTNQIGGFFQSVFACGKNMSHRCVLKPRIF